MTYGFPKPAKRQKLTPYEKAVAKALERKGEAREEKRNKYGAQPTDGFPSKLEAAVFQMLCFREKAGEIRDIQRQAHVDLGFGITWKVDFSAHHVATKQTFWVEAKGAWTEAALLKLRMWRNGAGPGPLEVWKGNYRKPELVETVYPRRSP